MAKDRTIKFRLTEDLYNTLLFKSKTANKTISDYIREAIISSEIKEDRTKERATIISAVNRIGNNINQIAYNLNIANKNEELNTIDYTELLQQLTVIEYKLNEVIGDK